MANSESEYREHVRQNLHKVLEHLAYLSFGDFTHRIDTENLPSDEFGEVFCGLEVLMQDLAESRAELDEQNARNVTRSELWQAASLAYASEADFVQALLDILGPYMEVARASYYTISLKDDEAACVCQWVEEDAESTVGMRVPGEIWRVLVGKPHLEVNRRSVELKSADMVRNMMDRTGIGSLIVTPCGDEDGPFGFVLFTVASTRREWSEQERLLLFETARIITTRVGQLQAEEALRQTNVSLNEDVKARTADLEQANKLLQDDIAKRTLTEEALRESESQHRSLVEASPDAILVCAPDGNIAMSNHSAGRLFGVANHTELRGSSLLGFVSSVDAGAANEFWTALGTKESARMIELHFDRSDGETFLGEFRAISLRGAGGGRSGYLVIVRDITDKRREEEQQLQATKLESLGTLAGGIAHDFNNILTGVMSNIGLAKSGTEEDGEIHRLLGDAEDAALRASDLTKQLLTFAKGGAPVTENADVAELIRHAARFCLSGSNVGCTFDIDENLPWAEVDRGQLDQVLNNLIINADQAMPGGGTITITAKSAVVDKDSDLSVEPGRYIHVSVGDSGCGIANEDLRRVFDPYFTSKKDGTGLGLTTAYSIITRHGGYLECVSTVGKGSEFRFMVPAATVVGNTEIVEPSNEVIRGEGRVLVMDDDPTVRLVLERLLQRAGYEVDAARDGDEAVVSYMAALKAGAPYSVVIMDLTVQGGKGGALAATEILSADPGASLIVVSGYSNDPVMANYADYGFKARIAKPFQTSELTATVKRVANST